jgi:hypothetical protein
MKLLPESFNLVKGERDALFQAPGKRFEAVGAVGLGRHGLERPSGGVRIALGFEVVKLQCVKVNKLQTMGECLVAWTKGRQQASR